MASLLDRYPLTTRQEVILDCLRRSDVPLRLTDIAHAMADVGEVRRKWAASMVRVAMQGLLIRGVVVRVRTPFRKVTNDLLEQYVLAKGGE